MNTQEIINEVASLPPDAQKQVEAFILMMRLRHMRQPSRKTNKSTKISESPFAGIWKDRDDMADGGVWLRNLRKTEWGSPRE